MRISFVIPTRDRHEELRTTLGRIGDLAIDAACAEVIVIDNASSEAVSAEGELTNGVRVEVVRLERNLAAAARNMGAERAQGQWVVMLDDDSAPVDAGFVEVLGDVPVEVAAVGADIVLADGSRERGGLPEVVVGCGVAYRRDAYLAAGGYDERYGFYGEEYDLCARLIQHGSRVVHDARFGVVHEKVTSGRDMNEILFRLVRNNSWTMLRYAPKGARRARLLETFARYGKIAWKEDALMGYACGIWELSTCSWWRQPRREMTGQQWDQFTGLAAARATFDGDARLTNGAKVAIVARGKNCWVVEEALGEMGVVVVKDERMADVLVVGTMSPGPMYEAYVSRGGDTRPVLKAWSLEHEARLALGGSSTMAA